MSTGKSELERLKKTLSQSSKEKILGISTTADVTNPPFILGSIRETKKTISATIILRDVSYLHEIIFLFDGFVDYFFIDCEVKNEVKNLENITRIKIKKSRIFIYKPNDFTVESLDVLIALIFQSLQDKRVLVLGAGNIGSKIALKLCERGADVSVYDKDVDKTQKIVAGLMLVKRSETDITVAEDPVISAKGCDLIIGCTPGTPVVSVGMVEVMNEKGKIIDAGNRTIMPLALALARERGVEAFSLSSLGGYIGMVENWQFQREILQKKRRESHSKYSIISPGVLGAKGDILVDDVDTPNRVFGVCDGNGGLLAKEDGMNIIESYVADNVEKGNILIIQKLYQ